MANEITIQNGGIVPLIENGGLDTILKPLIKEIYLFDSYVAGTSHIDDKNVFEHLSVGDKLKLQREQNKFDSNAIMIFNNENKKLGYIPEKDNIVFARLMDAGKMLSAKVASMTKKGNFNQIKIGIYLVDF